MSGTDSRESITAYLDRDPDVSFVARGRGSVNVASGHPGA